VSFVRFHCATSATTAKNESFSKIFLQARMGEVDDDGRGDIEDSDDGGR
jgi:hypothetical protein